MVYPPDFGFMLCLLMILVVFGSIIVYLVARTRGWFDK